MRHVPTSHPWAGVATAVAGCAALIGCADVQNPVVDEPEPEPVEEAVDDRCEEAPDAVVAAIEAALTVDAELEHPRLVASEDHDELHFVALEVLAHEQEDEPLIGIWAVHGDPGADAPEVLSVDAVSRASSEAPDGTRELGLSVEDDGGEEAKVCVEAAAEVAPDPEEERDEPEELRDEVDVEEGLDQDG